MTDRRHRAVVEFPSELEILVTRQFDAPVQLVFDTFTKVEHVRRTIAPYGEEVKACEIDLRVGGEYRYVFVTDDGIQMCFRGTFLELDPPHRMVETWIYDGWADTEAVETITFREHDGGTELGWLLTFADEAGRNHMGRDASRFDGVTANFDNVEDLLAELLAGARE